MAQRMGVGRVSLECSSDVDEESCRVHSEGAVSKQENVRKDRCVNRRDNLVRRGECVRFLFWRLFTPQCIPVLSHVRCKPLRTICEIVPCW